MGLACSPRVGEELALSDQPGCHPEERVLCRPRSPLMFAEALHGVFCQRNLVTHQISGEFSALI